MTVKSALLKIALRQQSDNAREVLDTFLRLAENENVTRTASSIKDDSDWTIADFFLGEVRFSAAYNETLEEVRILSIKFEHSGAINLHNASESVIEGFFLSWAQDALK